MVVNKHTVLNNLEHNTLNMSDKINVHEDCLDFQDLEDQLSQICDRSELEECLKKQLLEVEMLQAMYSNPGEFVMDNPGQLIDVNDFISGKISFIPPGIDFTINLLFDNMKVELCVALPLDYPVSEPDVFIRNNTFNRTQQQKLNEDFRNYMNSLDRGETCLYSIICWLQDNMENYMSKESSKLPDKDVIVNETLTFTRLWIYSHHIYSKTKRRDMLSFAGDLTVTGFVLPGKPGIICVEGNSDDSEEWWARVKAMNWKKIVVRKKETFPITSQEKLNKFSTFEEIAFKNNNRNNDQHMDMGEFHKFLEEHDCSYVFVDYFGVGGRTN